MIHICEEFQQLNGLITPLTEDYNRQIGIHFCRLRHRDVLCCSSAELMHDGTHPHITIVYIRQNLEVGARVIIKQLREHFPNEDDNYDEDFIMTCPGCGTPFSQQ